MPRKAAGAKPAGRNRTPATRARASRSKAVDWAPAFLVAFAETGNITTAAKLAEVARSTVYDRRESDAAFRAAFAEAADEASDALEAEARRRAIIGVEEPIIGRVGGRDGDDKWLRDDETGERLVMRRYSDQLLMFLLRANRPERFRDRYEVTHITEDKIDREIARLTEEIERRGGEVPNDVR